jgi:hypothetical protein
MTPIDRDRPFSMDLPLPEPKTQSTTPAVEPKTDKQISEEMEERVRKEAAQNNTPIVDNPYYRKPPEYDSLE